MQRENAVGPLFARFSDYLTVLLVYQFTAKMESLANSSQRMVYLITYSRVDTTKFSSKESFSSAILEAWQHFGIRILHWVVCIEAHSNNNGCASGDDNNMNLYHFHMAVKLAKRGRWLQVRNYLDEKYGIQVNFSDNHSSYYTAYRYVTKEDHEALHSPGHPDLSDVVPRTEAAITTRKRKAKAKGKGQAKKRSQRSERLSVYDVFQIVQSKGITSRLQLVCLAIEQNREGKSSLAQFIANRGNKAVDEAIELAKEFSQAELQSLRTKKTRIELLQEQTASECAAGCRGRWLEAADQLLQRHAILKEDFCTAVYTALSKGRGKYRNIFIHNDTNCGKLFILSPLKVIYKTFCNPATGSFVWLGAENAEIIFLNYFRWHPKIIAWADFRQALEGDTVHLPSPKNVCIRDLKLNKDAPFFASSDAPLVLIKAGAIDSLNTRMMNVRWRFYHFWNQIPKEEQEELIPYSRCFAKFILNNVSVRGTATTP